MEKTAMQEPTQEPTKERVTLTTMENLTHIAISAQAIANVTDAMLRTAGATLGLTDWALLHKLSGQTEAQPMARLSRLLGVTRQRIQKQIDDLAAAKLVDVQTSTEDKRVRNIVLTEKGRDALVEIDALWVAKVSSSGLIEKVKKLDGVRRRLETMPAMLGRLQRSALKASAAAKKAE